jgi:hypothetical protein
MSTRNLPPERRSEIARNAALARKGGGNRGPAPCHAPDDPTCKRCRARASEKRCRAAQKSAVFPLNFLHLDALHARLGHERARWCMAKTAAERVSRRVTVAGIEREIQGELEFLGFKKLTPAELTMTDEELLAEVAS